MSRLRKRRFLLLAAVFLGIALTGCSTNNEDKNETGSQVQKTESETPATTSSTEEIITIQEFGEELIAVLKKDNPDYEYSLKDERAISVSEDGVEFLQLNLENSYNEYSVKGVDLDSTLEVFADAMLTLLNERENQALISRESIMATVKPEDYIEYVREMGIEPVCDELAEGLYILYMHDLPEMAKPFTEEELAEAGIERSEVRELAAKNLTETLVPYLQINEVDGVYLTYGDGMYETGLILCDIWDLYPVEYDYVIGIPERSYLIIADSEDETAIENMKAAGISLYNEASYPITDELLYWDGSEFGYFTK